MPNYPPDLVRVIDLWAELPESLRLVLVGWTDLPEPGVQGSIPSVSN